LTGVNLLAKARLASPTPVTAGWSAALIQIAGVQEESWGRWGETLKPSTLKGLKPEDIGFGFCPH